MPTKLDNRRIDQNKRRVPPDWTEQDTQLIQYSVLTETLPHVLFSARLLHSGVPVFGQPQSCRQIFARELRQQLNRSLQSFRIGTSQLWEELPQNYDPSEYISHPDGNITLRI